MRYDAGVFPDCLDRVGHYPLRPYLRSSHKGLTRSHINRIGKGPDTIRVGDVVVVDVPVVVHVISVTGAVGRRY